MASNLTQDHLRSLARLGAERRLEELRKEEAAIRAAFPGIGARRAAKGGAKSAPVTAAAKRKRRKMSKAEKKAVSDRMKKYWAERKKAR